MHPRYNNGRLTETGFRTLLDQANPIKSDDPTLFVYHYMPLFLDVTFQTKEGTFRAELNSGIGFLLYPDGRVVAFGFRLPSNTNTANNVSEATSPKRAAPHY